MWVLIFLPQNWQWFPHPYLLQCFTDTKKKIILISKLESKLPWLWLCPVLQLHLQVIIPSEHRSWAFLKCPRLRKKCTQSHTSEMLRWLLVNFDLGHSPGLLWYCLNDCWCFNHWSSEIIDVKPKELETTLNQLRGRSSCFRLVSFDSPTDWYSSEKRTKGLKTQTKHQNSLQFSHNFHPPKSQLSWSDWKRPVVWDTRKFRDQTRTHQQLRLFALGNHRLFALGNHGNHCHQVHLEHK